MQETAILDDLYSTWLSHPDIDPFSAKITPNILESEAPSAWVDAETVTTSISLPEGYGYLPKTPFPPSTLNIIMAHINRNPSTPLARFSKRLRERC